jgi:hypothetical protein
MASEDGSSVSDVKMQRRLVEGIAMAKPTVDWNSASLEQIEASWHAWKVRLGLGAASWAVVAAILMVRGSAVVGAGVIAIGVVWVLVALRWAVATHRELRAEANERAAPELATANRA